LSEDVTTMGIDREAFKKAKQPTALLALVEKEVMQGLINGFSYKTGAGVTILYRSGSLDSAGLTKMDRLEPQGEPALKRRFFHSFCEEYWKEPDNKELCEECDKASAQRYFLDNSDKWTEPILYRCHKELWEMAYPIRVSDNVLAVLIAGQLIVTEGEAETKKALDSHSIRVDPQSVVRSGFPQVDAILRKCSAEKNRQTLEENLRGKKANRYEDKSRRPVNLDGLIARWKDFNDFGTAMEGLLAKFHTRMLEKAEESLLLQVSAELTAKSTDEGQYWEATGRMISEVSELTGLGSVDVYFRRGSHYSQKVSRGEVIHQQNAKWLPVHLTLDISPDKLHKVGEPNLSPELTELICAEPGALLYKCDFPNVDGQSLSTILVIHSPGVGKPLEDFALKFCRVIAQESDASGLLFGIMEDRQAFDDRVRRSSHASKTPQQAALAEVEYLEYVGHRAKVDDFRKALPGIKRNIRRASAEITEMLAGSTEPRKTVDLRKIVEGLLEEMRPIARQVEVGLAYQGPTEPVLVHVCEPDIRIAMRNLLDNAIKYSYWDKEVRLYLSVVHSRSAKFVVSNFGIGIPEELLSEIREIGGRANVLDEKAEKAGRARLGSGVGLPIAIKDIEEHGGSLHVTSQPADSEPRLPYHRFVTKVTVTLPIIKEER